MSKEAQPQGIVVGVDGSPSSEAALVWAARDAAMRHVRLTVVHVVPPAPSAASTLAWPAGRIPEEVLEIQENEAKNVITGAIELVQQTVDDADLAGIDSELVFGAPVPTLVDLAKDAQLVVVGCRGRTGLRGRALGSITGGLIRHARCPVAVIHDDVRLSPRAARLPVLLGVDGSRASEPATAIAFEEASWRGVDVVALHAWSDRDTAAVFGLEWINLQSQADATLAERLAGWQERYPDVTVHREVEFEHPARHLIDRSEQAQLVVVGSHGRGGFAGMLLGSVSTAVAQAVGVPIVVARPR